MLMVKLNRISSQIEAQQNFDKSSCQKSSQHSQGNEPKRQFKNSEFLELNNMQKSFLQYFQKEEMRKSSFINNSTNIVFVPKKHQQTQDSINTGLRRCGYRLRKDEQSRIEIVSFSRNKQNAQIQIQQPQQTIKLQAKEPSNSQKKRSQTKNIIKNNGKSILSFVRKNQLFYKQVLTKHNIKQTDFLKAVEYFRSRVNTIHELKVFWADQNNSFAKIFRILSNLYLRKHSLGKIFHSRIKNYHIHIKYRKRLLQILESPNDFSCIKYF